MLCPTLTIKLIQPGADAFILNFGKSLLPKSFIMNQAFYFHHQQKKQ